MPVRESAKKGDFSTNSSQISTLQRDRRYSQSGRSCHFSLSLHSQRIPGWGWPEEAAAPAPPENHTDRKTNTFIPEHSTFCLSWQSFPLVVAVPPPPEGIFILPLTPTSAELPPSRGERGWSFGGVWLLKHTQRHTQTEQGPDRTWWMFKVTQDGKENSHLGLMKPGTDHECLR